MIQLFESIIVDENTEARRDLAHQKVSNTRLKYFDASISIVSFS